MEIHALRYTDNGHINPLDGERRGFALLEVLFVLVLILIIAFWIRIYSSHLAFRVGFPLGTGTAFLTVLLASILYDVYTSFINGERRFSLCKNGVCHKLEEYQLSGGGIVIFKCKDRYGRSGRRFMSVEDLEIDRIT